MLFLEAENKIIKEVLEGRLGEKCVPAPRPVQPLEIRLCDFDDVQYDVSIADNLLTVSMAYPPFKTLEGLGAQQMFAVTYSEFQLVAAKTGFDFSLQVNVDLITPENSGVCFEALQNGSASSLVPVQIPYRRNETMYVLPQADRIIVVYSVCFEDKTDQAVARVFLQVLESRLLQLGWLLFVDTRRTVNNAPPVAFNKDPPLELRGAPGLRNSPDLVGYLSLAIFPTHVATTEKRIKAATLVQGLRNYLHYHIKASKTYLHIRMRKRVDLLLQGTIACWHFQVSRLYGNLLHLPAFSTAASSEEASAAVAEPVTKKPKQQQQQPVVETTWNTLVVGEIVDFHAHPQADRLNVCAVNIGDKEDLLQIICGAPNVRQGARVPVAKVGTRLAIKEPESGELYVQSECMKKLKIKKSKLRGEVSQGMICSEAELGLADESDGILILDDDAVVGSLVLEYSTIASRLQARGIIAVKPTPVVAPLQAEPTSE
ncbi:hypothetical protein BBJ28_00023421 [Nothophytophthora sp. Chile5]|nr:hypothetical protein BBJ28_00023421 [Nothophytophthora sp. Chile5]